MSSATKRFRRAGVGGVSALVAVTSFLAASPAFADVAGAQIGVVDKGNAQDGRNTGATLVTAGAGQGQMLGDVRLLIPNTFAKGDKIDLKLESPSSAGVNTDADHALGFTDKPSVNVDPQAYTKDLNINSSTDDTTTPNTEHGARPASDSKTDKAPDFTVERTATLNNGVANDHIVLTFTGDSNGIQSDKWVVTLKDLEAKIGKSILPGELTLTPQSATDEFAGQYTVPGFVTDATLDVASPTNVVGDGTPQNIGDVTIAETNNSGLDQGASEDYTVTLGGVGSAVIANTDANPVKVKLVNAGSHQDIGAPAPADDDYATVAGDGKSLSFTLNSTDAAAAAAGKLSVVLSGLQVKADRGDKGTLTYTLSGGDLQPYSDSSANQNDISFTESEVGHVFDAKVTPLTTRLAGADRYGTAAKVALSRTSYTNTIVLASGENYADALSSSYLATTQDAVTLLTHRDHLPEVTRDALRQLTGYYYNNGNSDERTTVFVVGSAAAVSDSVINDLRNNVYGSLNVIRLGGDDRYATNRKVNEYAFKSDGVGRTVPAFGKSGKYTAMVASGQDFADALAAGPATAGAFDDQGSSLGAIPLILTKSAHLSDDAAQQLDDFNIQRAVIIGGKSVVSDDTESAIQKHDASTERLAGSNRFETAAAVADWETTPAIPTATQAGGGLGFRGGDVYLASGMGYADALSVGALAGSLQDPLLLAKQDDLTDATASWLRKSSGYNSVIGVGSAAAISNDVLQRANNIIAQ